MKEQIRKKKELGEAEKQRDHMEIWEAEMKYQAEQEAERAWKKQQMEVYKKQLDSQMNVKKQAALYGNMTGVEKQMNKDEMLAYKNYETKTMAFIPGLNSKAPMPSERVMNDKLNHPSGRTVESDIDRLKKFGMTRDFTKDIQGAHIDAHRTSMAQI